jgi:acyl dehydratase
VVVISYKEPDPYPIPSPNPTDPNLFILTLTYAGVKAGVNYGLNKLRFISPVHVGSEIRTRVTLKEVSEVPGGFQLVSEVSVEQKRAGSSEPEKKPAAIAETISRIYL